jgi:hypothetical protein
MKHNKIISLGAVAVALAAVVGIAAVSMAATDNQNQPAELQNKPKRFGQELTEAQEQKMQARWKEMEAKRTAVDAALAANDYQAWLTAVGADCDKAKLITSDKFPQLVQAYQLEQEGKAKLDQARQIREQLGLKGPEQGKGQHKGPARGFIPPAKTN